jgi:hypothetical protein
MLENEELETPRESRLTAFQGGAGMPGGATLNTATSMQENVVHQFHVASVLNLPNLIPTVNGMSQETYNQTKPQQAMLRELTGYSSPTP